MKDKKIVRLVTDWLFFPDTNPKKQNEAIRTFIERVAIPKEIVSYSYEAIKSYIRDALARGTDHWDFCSLDEAQVKATREILLKELEKYSFRNINDAE